MNSDTIIGTSIGVLLIGTTVFSLRKRNRDIRTSKVLHAIQIQLQPSSNRLRSQNAFDIHYLDKVLQRTHQSIIVLKSSTADRYAKQIHQAWGNWFQGGDDEQKVYAVFRKMKDKVQVSQVAKSYQELYATNLIDTLKNRFDTEEITIVLTIVKALPNYRTV